MKLRFHMHIVLPVTAILLMTSCGGHIEVNGNYAKYKLTPEGLTVDLRGK